MFWMDFKEEKSLLSESLRIGDQFTEEMLAAQLDRMFTNQQVAEEMTEMFNSNIAQLLAQNKTNFFGFFDLSQEEYMGQAGITKLENPEEHAETSDEDCSDEEHEQPKMQYAVNFQTVIPASEENGLDKTGYKYVKEF